MVPGEIPWETAARERREEADMIMGGPQSLRLTPDTPRRRGVCTATDNDKTPEDGWVCASWDSRTAPPHTPGGGPFLDRILLLQVIELAVLRAKKQRLERGRCEAEDGSGAAL